LIVGFLYQIYANDKLGVMGTTLRSIVQSTGIQGNMDDTTFATFWASLFVIASGVLMLPEFLGASWNPFLDPARYVFSMVTPPAGKAPLKAEVQGDTDSETDDEPSLPAKNRRKNKKKKTN
jgi:hypothetical protein